MLGEKIAELRKQNHMSQEELASRLGISRQSVSKWESGQSQPEIDKLLQLSELFHVSVDYLLKDSTLPSSEVLSSEKDVYEAEYQDAENIWEETAAQDADPRIQNWKETIQKTFFNERKEEMEPEQYILRLEEAEEYLSIRRKKGDLTSFGTMECVLSVIPVVLGASASRLFGISDDFCAMTGLIFMLLLIAHAVSAFMKSASLGKDYRFMDRIILTPEYKAEALIREKAPKMRKNYTDLIRTGVVLCILSLIPILIGTALNIQNDSIFFILVSCMLGIIAEAVRRFVKAGYINGTVSRLMQEGSYRKEMKLLSDTTSLYWGIITCAYLGISFVTSAWHISWIIWVFAGIAYNVVFEKKQ